MTTTYLKIAAAPLVLSLLTLTPSSAITAQATVRPPVQATAAKLDDPTIVAIFDAANGADIETGRLAAKRGSSMEVRQFGAMLARDHEAVRQQGRDLAKRLGVIPTPATDKKTARDHAATMERLGKLQGEEFDRAFLQYEESFHRNVISAVNTTLLPAITNQELRALVVKVAPAFEAHMIMARNLGQRLAAK